MRAASSNASWTRSTARAKSPSVAFVRLLLIWAPRRSSHLPQTARPRSCGSCSARQRLEDREAHLGGLSLGEPDFHVGDRFRIEVSVARLVRMADFYISAANLLAHLTVTFFPSLRVN